MSSVSLAVRAVVFDFGGVLSFSPTDEDWHALAGIVGVPLSSFFEPYWKDRNEYDVDKFDSAVYWRKVASNFGRELTDEDVHKLVSIDNQAVGSRKPQLCRGCPRRARCRFEDRRAIEYPRRYVGICSTKLSVGSVNLTSKSSPMNSVLLNRRQRIFLHTATLARRPPGGNPVCG